FVSDGGGGDEPVGPRLDQPHEEAGAHETRDAGLELCADVVGKIGGDETVGRLPLGRHGATLGVGNALRDLLKLAHLTIGQTVGPKPERPDQRAVHYEVGIAADGRGEVSVAAEVEPE